jgi:hypothetical protein
VAFRILKDPLLYSCLCYLLIVKNADHRTDLLALETFIQWV